MLRLSLCHGGVWWQRLLYRRSGVAERVDGSLSLDQTMRAECSNCGLAVSITISRICRETLKQGRKYPEEKSE